MTGAGTSRRDQWKLMLEDRQHNVVDGVLHDMILSGKVGKRQTVQEGDQQHRKGGGEDKPKARFFQEACDT